MLQFAFSSYNRLYTPIFQIIGLLFAGSETVANVMGVSLRLYNERISS